MIILGKGGAMVEMSWWCDVLSYEIRNFFVRKYTDLTGILLTPPGPKAMDFSVETRYESTKE